MLFATQAELNARIVFTPGTPGTSGYSLTDQSTIEAHLWSIYQTPSGEALIDAWLGVSSARNIVFTFEPDSARALALDSGHVIYDLDFNSLGSGFLYISPSGIAVAEQDVGTIAHELGHALTMNTDDDWPTYDDWSGSNLNVVNQIFAELGMVFVELGIVEQLSYPAADNVGALTLGRDYSDGGSFDRAYVGGQESEPYSGNFQDISSVGNFKDLLIGDFQDNIFSGGDGDDILYGQGATDTLSGEAGADKIFGGSGDDTILGGAGDDELYGHEKVSGSGIVPDDGASDGIDGGAGADRMYGGLGNDLFYEADDSGNDIIHGGHTSIDGSEMSDGDLRGAQDGFDTVSYSLSEATNILYLEDGEDQHLATVSQRVGDPGTPFPIHIDTLISIENVIGTQNNDTFNIRTNETTNRYDGGGHTGSFLDSDFGDKITYEDNHTGVQVSRGPGSGLLVQEMESSNGVVDTVTGFEKITLTDFDDEIESGTHFLTIEAGAGEDRIAASGLGSVVYGGSDKDTFILAGPLTLVADAEAIDEIEYGGRILKGAVAPTQASEKGSIFFFPNAVRYSFNEGSELVIVGVGGQSLYIASADVGPDAKSRTAGLIVGVVEWTSYQLLDPAFPGGKAYIDGFSQVMDAIRALFFDEEVVGTDPLVLDLDGDGLELSARSSLSPLFDIDSDGFAERSGWVYGGDGFLAVDANSDGIINDVSELFGNATTSGFEELATHDLNTDGVIDASDAVFAILKVWRDSDSDGVTDAGELLTLGELGIESIALPAAPADPVIQAGNTITATSIFTLTGGVTRTIGDVVFNVDQVNTVFLGDSTISSEALALPELHGYGELPSLRIAATLDPGLVPVIETAATGATSIDLSELAENIRPLLNAWAAGDYTTQAAGPEPEELPQPIYYQYSISETGDVTLTRYIYAAVKTVEGSQVTYYRSTSGSITTADPETGPTFSEAVDWLEAQAASEGGYVATFGSAEVETLERFTGADVPLEEVFGDPLLGPLDPHGLNSASGDERAAIGQYVEAYARLEVQAGVTFAVQSGLSASFPEVSYDAVEGVFVAATPGNLQAAYLAILGNAPSGGTAAAEYLSGWAPLLKVFLSQFDRGADHLVNSFSYQFGNLVGGYEALSSFPISIEAAALALGIPNVIASAGTTGGDIVYVSNGDETIDAGKGLDSYVFGGAFGDVIIDDRELVGQSGGAPDNLRFAVHAAADVVATRAGNDLILTFAATEQSVTVKDQFLRERFSAPGTRLDDDRGVVEIVFADGVVWDEVDMAQAVSHASSASETIVGTRHFDWLDGGAGDDTLSGGNSTDIYIFGSGYGHDRVHEYGPGLTGDNGIFILLEGDDFVRFGAGLTFDDLDFSRDGNSRDLVVTIEVTGETLTIVDQFLATNTGPFGVLWYDRVEMFSFDEDGTLVTWEDILKEVVVGTEGNDTIYGFYYQDILDGGAGDDFLSGGDEDDVYYFGIGDGSDTIQEGQTNVLTASHDRLIFKAGVGVGDVTFARDGATRDLIVSINGTDDQVRIKEQYAVTETGPYGPQAFDLIETFEWADGTTKSWAVLRQELIDAASTEGDDTIYGSHFNDTFNAGGGNDRLEGGNGADTYVFASGDGEDTIADYASNALAVDGDTLVFTDLNSVDLVLSRVGADSNDFRLTHTASGSSVTIENQFDYTTLSGVRFYELETIEFANAEAWTVSDMREAWLEQNSTEGNDTITGFQTDDTLIGGEGDDVLAGGDGSDTYVFSLGHGDDVIRESVGNSGYDDDDRIVFNAGLAASDLVLTRSGANLMISFTGQTGSILIEGQFTSAAYFGSWTDIEFLEFSDSTVLDANDIRLSLLAAASTSGNDTITGFYTADVIEGGAGDDILQGSSGGDVYLYNSGDGDDLIYDILQGHLFLDGPDTVIFGPGILREDVTFSIDGDDLLATIAGGGSIRIQDHITGNFTQVETFQFADGTILTAMEAEINAASGQGTSGDDFITGSQFDDVIQGGAGNDTLSGVGGSDTYIFRLGDGQDIINDGGGYDSTGTEDTLSFGPGISSDMVSLVRTGNDLTLLINGTTDQVHIEGQFDTSGFNYLKNWQMVERISFADGVVWEFEDMRAMLLDQSITHGNDVIRGFWTPDVIDGLGGDDELRGSTGADTYLFGLGSGNDTIFESVDHHLFLDGDDTILFGDGIGVEDLSYTRDGNDLVFTIIASGETLTINNQYSSTAQNQTVEIYSFTNGEAISLAEIEARVIQSQETAGNDIIIGTAAGDTLNGGLGDDLLHGGVGSDTYVYNLGDGADRIEEPSSAPDAGDEDRILFGEGLELGDLIVERTGSSLTDVRLSFEGLAGSITIWGQLAAAGPTWDESWRSMERFEFADGTLISDFEIRELAIASQVTDGDDTIYGTYTQDVLRGGLGNDFLDGQARNDTYLYARGDGSDTINDNGNSVSIDTLSFAAGISQGDLTFVKAGEDLQILIAGTSDTITIINQFDLAQNGYENDWIEHFAFASGPALSHAEITQQIIDGAVTSGDDLLTGYYGDDILNGLAGDDTLSGLKGNDTYIVSLGGGDDLISDAGTSAADVVAFQEGITEEGVAYEKVASNLIIHLLATGEKITVAGQFSLTSSVNRIESFSFAGGPVLTAAQVEALAYEAPSTYPEPTIIGTLATETLNGTAGNDVFLGDTGNDTLQGSDGDDTYVWRLGDGNDIVNERGYADDAPDTDTLFLTGVAAEDLEFARWGEDLRIKHVPSGALVEVDDHFKGTAWGVEQILLDDATVFNPAELAELAWFRGTASGETINGSAGNDTLVGNGGNDTLQGSDGNDTYVWHVGDGNDLINEAGLSTDVADTDVLKLVGVTAGDLQFSRAGNDLRVTHMPSAAVIEVDDHFKGPAWGIEQLILDDETVLDPAALADLAWFRGTTGNEIVTGSAAADTLLGDTGDDTLRGTGGSDTYIWRLGDGNDIIDELGSAPDTDTLLLTGVAAGDLEFTRTGDDLLIEHVPSGAVLSVDDHFYSTTYGLELVTLDDETTYDRSALSELSWYRGTSGNETINGSSGAETLFGDTGNDTLRGAAGSDTYVWRLGDGNDIIDELGSAPDTDTLRLTGVAAVDLEFTRTGDDLLIEHVPSGAVLTVDDHFYSATYGIERVVFDDATELTATDIATLVSGGLPPVILDLDGDGRYFSGRRVAFDFDSDGELERGSWFDRGDGMLVLDRNQDGRINDGSEVSFVKDLPGAVTDLEGLAAFDSDGDRLLTAGDAAFGDFQIWRDLNLNGVSDPGELMSLAGAGITAIGLTSEPYSRASGDGPRIFGTTTALMADGRQVGVADAELNFSDAPIRSGLGGGAWRAPASMFIDETDGGRGLRDFFGRFEGPGFENFLRDEAWKRSADSWADDPDTPVARSASGKPVPVPGQPGTFTTKGPVYEPDPEAGRSKSVLSQLLEDGHDEFRFEDADWTSSATMRIPEDEGLRELERFQWNDEVVPSWLEELRLEQLTEAERINEDGRPAPAFAAAHLKAIEGYEHSDWC